MDFTAGVGGESNEFSKHPSSNTEILTEDSA